MQDTKINSFKPKPFWLEQLPLKWDIIPIKFGLVIPITDGPHETPNIYNDGVPFLSAEAVKEDKLDFSRKRGFISLEEHKRFSKKYIPQKGDVFMVKSGATTGNVARVETNEEFNIWSPLAALRPNNHLLITDYLFYFMKSRPFFHSVELGWNFGTQQNIGMGVIANLQMALPSIETQKQITKFLDHKTKKIDKLIKKKKQLIKKLEEKRIAVITQAVTKGLDKNVKLKPSGVDWLGDVPEHWEVRRLRFCIISNPAKSEIKNLNGDDLVSFVPMEDVNEYGGMTLNQTKMLDDVIGGYTYFKERDVVVAKITPCFENGKGSLSTGLVNGIGFGTTELHVLRKDENMDEEYIFYLTISYPFRKNGEAIMVGAGGHKRISEDYIKDYRQGVPGIDEQKLIADYIKKQLHKIDVMTDVSKQVIDLYEEYRSSIITSAVTGKIDV